jgi:iron complex transport system permease protein
MSRAEASVRGAGTLRRSEPGPERPIRAGKKAPEIRPAKIALRWWLIATGVLLAAMLAGLAIGSVDLPPGRVALDLLDRLPFVSIDSGLTSRESAIIWELRLPRVLLGVVVGAMLAASGAAYQGAFRNPLADPYLLGAAAGAGLGVTLVIVGNASGFDTASYVPVAAFAGALSAVMLTYVLGAAGGTRGRLSPASLILAGVAVASFLTALQTFVQERNQDTIRQVYSWILGRLGSAGWADVRMVLPYAVLTTVVLLAYRRTLDVLSVGDDEANALGLDARRSRLIIIVAASLGTAAAVSVSGLIGFVGIIVPHTVRLLAGSSARVILPLSLLFGGAFLVIADIIARTAFSPAEIPIGVVTAFFGAPFFIIVLRTSRRLT